MNGTSKDLDQHAQRDLPQITEAQAALLVQRLEQERLAHKLEIALTPTYSQLAQEFGRMGRVACPVERQRDWDRLHAEERMRQEINGHRREAVKADPAGAVASVVGSYPL